ncbi:Uncharacterized protein HZ326_29252 [Fusarium oxysporum f. sp. albedinis]|nr:Uncharacterized protein HZ326_29252 [Fusarium oxysporum f. sp. albedinis]
MPSDFSLIVDSKPPFDHDRTWTAHGEAERTWLNVGLSTSPCRAFIPGRAKQMIRRQAAGCMSCEERLRQACDICSKSRPCPFYPLTPKDINRPEKEYVRRAFTSVILDYQSCRVTFQFSNFQSTILI